MKVLLSLFLAAFAVNSLGGQTQLDEGSVQLEVNFDLDQSRLDARQKQKVDSLLEATPLSIIKQVEIYGHTDSLAGVDYNRQLSRRRVQAILQYLVYKGLDPLRVKADYYGEERPRYDNGPAERFRNRRCELVFRIDPALIPDTEARLTDFEFKKGESIRIPNLRFVGNQPIPVSQSFQPLNDLLTVMKAQPDLKIELRGHVCCHDNLELSEARARMVFDFLYGNGIERNRISYQGYSNKLPLLPERDDDEKAMNRRVEVFVLENSDRRAATPQDADEMELRAPMLDVKFFPKKSRLYPSGHFMLTLVAEMMREPAELSYEFVVFDNINDQRLTQGRASAMERALLAMEVEKDIFSVRAHSKTQRMPESENDNLVMVKITQEK